MTGQERPTPRPLDATDRQLLDALRRHARSSHADLAARVHLSRNAVRQRIERLERDGFILGYTIRERPPERAPVAATLLISRADRMRGAEVIEVLRAIPEVVQCDVVSGELDLVVRLEAADAERIRERWSELARLPGVSDIVTAWSLSTVVDRR